MSLTIASLFARHAKNQLTCMKEFLHIRLRNEGGLHQPVDHLNRNPFQDVTWNELLQTQKISF